MKRRVGEILRMASLRLSVIGARRFLLEKRGGLKLALLLLTIAGTIGDASPQGGVPANPLSQQRPTGGNIIDVSNPIVERDPRTERFCPDTPASIVEIKEADKTIDEAHHNDMLKLLVDSVQIPNTTIRLGPNVILDFSKAPPEYLPLNFKTCVTLTSVKSFPTRSVAPVLPTRGPAPKDRTAPTKGKKTAPVKSAAVPSSQRLAPRSALTARANPGSVTRALDPEPGRTPTSAGPLLKFGPVRPNETVFMQIKCDDNQLADGVRISGLRIEGPSLGQQETHETGIQIWRCLEIEISNNEIFGWGGNGVEVGDDEMYGDGQDPSTNNPGDRIGRTHQVRIFNNYIHHNQHPREGLFSGGAHGYGVKVNIGAWAQIFENLFDSNRHSIAGSGDSGGYEARRNLVLKGGGYHYAGVRTHQFDIHGTGDNGFGGQASEWDWFSHNAFQYLAGHAIEIRGRPRRSVEIYENVFPHEGLEHDDGDDAISVDNRDDLDVIKISSSNDINYDSFGRYGVCDFDGDAVDDLFLATGVTWWFSGYGEFPWSYLNLKTERLDRLRLGYFDNDNRCDVLTEQNGAWMISSGGTGDWRPLGSFGAPLNEVQFGRFDANVRDSRPGVTRATTHAFRRAPDGQWYVTPLTSPDWKPVASSGNQMNKLRFGDFTGDGVTDVLAVVGGRWSISESATNPWRTLNNNLGDAVANLFIANMDRDDNIDDILRVDREIIPAGNNGVYTSRFIVTWKRSRNGVEPWRLWKRYEMPYLGPVTPLFAFAGRFGAAPGGGTLVIDPNRVGLFHSEAEIAAGGRPDWTSRFQY